MDRRLHEAELEDLIAYYEPQADVSAAGRWRALFDSEAAGPLVLVNRFVFHETAVYDDGGSASGQEAFGAYAAVSMPALGRVGGRFLSSGTPMGVFGSVEEADFIVVGWYPTRAAFLALLRDPEYRAAFRHRRAALRVDEVVAVDALPL